MNDTHPDIAARYNDMLAKRTPTERMQGAFSLLFSAQELTKAGIRSEYPQLSDLDLQCAMVDKFYGKDLSSQIRNKFIAQLRRISS